MWNVVYAIMAPIFIFAGIAFNSTLMVAIFMDLCAISLFYPNWRFVIRPIVGGSFREYVVAIFNMKVFCAYAKNEFNRMVIKNNYQ